MNITGLNESFVFIKQEVVEKESFPPDDGVEDMSFDEEHQCIKEMPVSAKMNEEHGMKLVPLSSTSGEGQIRSGRGVTLKSQSRLMVKRLLNYFSREKNNLGPLISVNRIQQRVSDALQISLKTVRKISKEGPETSTPGKTRPKKSPKTGIGTFDEQAIRNHIYDYYTRKEFPTLKRLKASLLAAGLFDGGITSLHKVVHNLGFKWKKVCGRRFLLERSDIVVKRSEFLRKIRSEDFSKIVFLDETWINAGHTCKKSRTETLQASKKEPAGKGERLIVVHAGTGNGFIPNSLHIFQSKKRGDYHEEMNAETFKKWFTALLKNIPSNSTIVMDNAPYHSILLNKAPTLAQRKSEIQGWLRQNNLDFEEDLVKCELLELVKCHRERFVTNELEEIAKNQGHKVITLPPYHCEFNPIELIWAQVKGKVAKENKNFKIKEVEELTRKAIEEVSPENWSNAVRQVEKVIEATRKRDGVLEESVAEMIIAVTASSSSDSDEDSDSSDSDEEGI